MITLISGSIRQDSMNMQLIEYVSGLLKDREHQILNLRNYPIFDPDLDSTSFPPEIKDLRKQITDTESQSFQHLNIFIIFLEF